MKKKQIAIVSLGGNALITAEGKQTIEEQMNNLRKALKIIPVLLKQGYRIVITHGNGPQVGNILLRSEIAKKKAYVLPLDVCVGQSQGEIGYLIQKTIHNMINKKNQQVVPILTQVLVDKKDSAFRKPSKPIGPFYKTKQKGMVMKKFPKGWRRVVASPTPLRVIEARAVEELLHHGAIVVACGGGGIPVSSYKGKLKGIEAVIDKDLATVCLAKAIKADTLIIVTEPRGVYINYKRPKQQLLLKVIVKELKGYQKKGHFPEGTMGPKIKAAITFIKQGGKKVIITSVQNAPEALTGTTGTTIVK